MPTEVIITIIICFTFILVSFALGSGNPHIDALDARRFCDIAGRILYETRNEHLSNQQFAEILGEELFRDDMED